MLPNNLHQLWCVGWSQKNGIRPFFISYSIGETFEEAVDHYLDMVESSKELRPPYFPSREAAHNSTLTDPPLLTFKHDSE